MESPPSISFAVTLLVVVAVLTATPLLQRLTELLQRLHVGPLAVLGQLSLATTTTEPMWPVISDMPPRQRRPRRNGRVRTSTPAPVPVERTRPVTASTDAAMFEQPQLPPGPSTPPTGEVVVGDVVNSSEQPVLELDSPHDQLNVVVNVSYARNENGRRAVRVLDRRGEVLLQLTAAQAHQLALDLTQSADVVGTIRVQAGYDN